MTPPSYSQPNADELEISLFGSVVGESIVVHLGENQWLIVDSCIHADSGRPAPLHYLESIGVDPATAVKLVVLTHWHDDHIGGAAEIVARCATAFVACSSAMRSDEFASLLSVYGRPDIVLDKETCGLTELKKVFSTLVDRQKRRSPAAHPKWIGPDRLLETFPLGRVVSLSPSDRDLTRAKAEFGLLVPKPGEEPRKVPVRPERNHNAAVLWILADGYRTLLGSDLEETAHPDSGWKAVLKSAYLPDTPAGCFKIPHHGSDSAHSDDVWTKLVRADSPIAILTTYMRGVQLPKPSDVARMLTKTSAVYCATPVPVAPPRRNPTVERTLREVVHTRRVLRGKTTGHIRVRVSPPMKTEQVDLFGAASLLQ